MNSIITLFLASLLGSLHCAGMCGGFATFCAGGDNRRVSAAFAYNFGRLITYTILGASAGAVGGAAAGKLGDYGYSHLVGIVIGCLILIWGLAQLFGYGRISTTGPACAGQRTGWLVGILNKVRELPAVPRGLIVGVLSTWLPCGWLYAFVGLAAASGSAASGVFTMFIFWLGTLPIMLAIGKSAQTILTRWGAQVPAISAALLIASGFFSIASHLGILPGHDHHSHHHQLDVGDESAGQHSEHHQH